jgi:concentrative nucleoside transporter, CNT family
MSMPRATQRVALALFAFLVSFGLFTGFVGRAVAQETPPPAATETKVEPAPATADVAARLKANDTGTTMGDRVQSLFGMGVLLAICYALSNNRSKISWRVVGWGMGLQVILGILVLKAPWGKRFFEIANDVICDVIDCTTKGSEFLFGDLAKFKVGFIFAFNVLPTIIFFSSLMAVMYHLGVMQMIVKGVAWVMQRTMGTSGSETLSASGNIFVGQTEAPLLVRPFVPGMTQSELMAVMTGGFATVAGGVMAAYVGLLKDNFPGIAGHLLSASVMSAPAALVCAKLMIPEPEPEKSETYGQLKVDLEKVDANIIDAAARGAGDGLKLALNVGAMLLAFIALIAMLNGLVGWSCSLVGLQGVTLEGMLGTVLAPLAWIMGTPWADCPEIGQLIGVKTVLNEFVAYINLSEMIKPVADGAAATTPHLTHPRSVIIATYALCGFSNFSSIAIQIGGIGGIAPERRHDLAKLGLKAMVAGSLACFLTATVAGMLV